MNKRKEINTKKYLNVINALVDSGYVSKSYLSVLTDIAIKQAIKNLEQELDLTIDFNMFKKEMFDKCG